MADQPQSGRSSPIAITDRDGVPVEPRTYPRRTLPYGCDYITTPNNEPSIPSSYLGYPMIFRLSLEIENGNLACPPSASANLLLLADPIMGAIGLGDGEDTEGLGTDVENEEDMDPEDDDVDDDGMDDEAEEDEEGEEEDEEPVAPFDPSAQGLKEISNLGKVIISSYKPGNGVEELRSDDLGRFWQSDGPQPHRLTMHFIRRVEIRKIRFYVDYNEDESYTPTRIRIEAGTGWHDLQELCEMVLPNPVGWQEVPIAGSGAGVDGNSLACWIFQLVILENHQNGKDTHIRGLKVYALDDSAATMSGSANPMGQMLDAMDVARTQRSNPGLVRSQAPAFTRGVGMSSHTGPGGRDGRGYDEAEAGDRENLMSWVADLEDSANQTGGHGPGEGGLGVPDFMREPEIR